MNKAILVCELKGFADMAVVLAKRMDAIGISAARVRGAARQIVENAIATTKSSLQIEPDRSFSIGGDTWYFTFSNMESAVRFAAELLSTMLDFVMVGGIFYLKPSLGISFGKAQLSGNRFMDDLSISAYRKADSGEPFQITILPSAHEVLGSLEKFVKVRRSKTGSISVFDWTEYVGERNLPASLATGLNISSLLTDNDVAHFKKSSDVVRQIIREQSDSSELKIFGGVVPCDDPVYFQYAKSAIARVGKKKGQCVVQNYYIKRPSVGNYVWLRVCERLVKQFGEHFVYSAYLLPEDAIRPIAYHIYDDVAMLFLRRYQESNNMVSMGSSIVIKNSELATQLRDHFKEGFKLTAPFGESEFSSFEDEFRFTREVKKSGDALVKKLFKK